MFPGTQRIKIAVLTNLSKKFRKKAYFFLSLWEKIEEQVFQKHFLLKIDCMVTWKAGLTNLPEIQQIYSGRRSKNGKKKFSKAMIFLKTFLGHMNGNFDNSAEKILTESRYSFCSMYEKNGEQTF